MSRQPRPIAPDSPAEPSARRARPPARSPIGGLLAALLVSVLAACTAGAGTPTSTPPGTATTSPSPLPSATATPAPTPAWPLTLTDDEGTKVTITAPPARIVSLTPAETETLFALGAGQRLVGGTDADDYPTAAASVPHVVVQTKVVLEKLVAAKPDLVIAGGDGFTPAADIARIRGLGIPVLVVYAATVDGVLHDLELTGQAIGAASEADALVTGMRARIAAVTQAAAATGSKPRTFYEIGYGPDLYGPAKDSFVADLVTRAGGDPITTGDPASYTMPLEQLVNADPQVIVLGDADYGTTVASVYARSGWGGITAVRDGAVVPVHDEEVTRPGPRLADGLAALAAAIHPGLAVPTAPSTPAPASATP